MDDLISRQAAIEEANEWLHDCFGVSEKQDRSVGLIRRLEDLPSAQPKRNIGKWIVVKRHEHYPSGKPYEQVQCPFCKRFDNNGDGSFCGYCGAMMERSEE